VDQIFYGPAHIAPTPDNVLGCISLVIWALTLIVGLKYAVFILRADNDGEGGVFALYSLLHNYREEATYLPLLLAERHAWRRLLVPGRHHLTRHQRAGGCGGP
jgi:KUP system potassium uptake protein